MLLYIAKHTHILTDGTVPIMGGQQAHSDKVIVKCVLKEWLVGLVKGGTHNPTE